MVSKLIVFQWGEKIATVALDQERVRVGRKPYNDLTLTHSTVSGEHAVVTTVRNDTFIEDLDSTNGTRLNGQWLIQKQLLHNGDEIILSPYVLYYVHEPIATVAFAEGALGPNRDLALDRQGLTASLATLCPKETANTGRDVLPIGVLCILSGPTAGRKLVLTRPLTLLGKPGIQVVAIARRQADYHFVCVEGDDSPLVNEILVDKGTTITLTHWDTVELAGVKMKFLLKQPFEPVLEGNPLARGAEIEGTVIF